MTFSLAAGWKSVTGWLDADEGFVLQAAVHSSAPDTAIVEAGTWCGRSLACLAEARALDPRPDARSRLIVSYDPYPSLGQAQEAAGLAGGSGVTPDEARAACVQLVGVLGLTNVHLRRIDAIEGAKDFARLFPNVRVGCLYLDDHHEGQRVIDELAAWEPLMADECEVCLHDFHHIPYGIEKAIDRFIYLDHVEWIKVEEQRSMFRMRRRWQPVDRKPFASKYLLGAGGAATSGGTRISPPGAQAYAVPGWADVNSETPLVSVLYNTFRVGGLDALKAGLDRQTLLPALFEVVIVDALFFYRAEVVRALFKDAPYRVIHVNPTRNPFPRDHGNSARNDAIRCASGEVLVWWCDFSIAESRSLERHLATVKLHGKNASSCGHIVYGEISVGALHPDFMAALPFKTIDDYADFVESLPADSPLWTTIFNAPVRELGQKGLISGQHGNALPYEMRYRVEVSKTTVEWSGRAAVIAKDTRLDFLNGPAESSQVYYAKNEATARETLVDLNGWEESFDDGHGSDDLDLCRRFLQTDHVLIVDKGNECFVPNARPFFPLMRWKRSPLENRVLFETLEQIGRKRAVKGLVNEMDLIPKPQGVAPAVVTPLPSCAYVGRP